MKKIFIAAFWYLIAGTWLQAQPVIFVDSSELLQPVTGFVNYSDCVVDVNNDYLDDIVRVGEKGVFIDYQQKDSSFFRRQFNFSVQSTPSWSICAGDLDNNSYNDFLFAGSSLVSFVMADSNATDYSENVMPGLIESQRSTIADINNDGWLDAFVCNESGQSIPYRNLGNGVMIPDSNLIITSNLVGNYAALWLDYDIDGDIDLYISKCWESALPGDSIRTNLMYRNNGDGTFTEVAGQLGLNDNAQTWSTAFEDFDNDGDLDAFIINHDFANRLMRNNGNGTFTEVIHGSGIDSLDLIGYEAQAADFNNDGFIDLFTDLTTGLYLGHGDMTFTGQDIPFSPGGTGDVNNDGAIDVMQDNKLWINTGNENHWIKINLYGISGNHNGIGARIELYGDWGIQVREVRSGEGYSPMNSLTKHFGLGNSETIDSLIVHWPTGIISKLNNLKSDTSYVIPEASCLLPNISLDINGPISLCSWESIPIPGPYGYLKYQWSNGDTSRITVLDKEGNYYLVVTDSSGCVAISQTVEVKILEDQKPVITAIGSTKFCEGDTLVLESSPGENYRWSTGELLQQSIEVTESGSYTVAVDAICFDGQITSDPIQVIALPSPPPMASDVFLFPGDSALLIATGENIHWYDQPEGGMLLNVGAEFQTSSLDSSVTFYIESQHIYPAEIQSGGKFDSTGAGGLPEQNGHLIFETWQPFVLSSVNVYVPEGGPQGVRFIQLWTNDILMATKSFNVVEGLNVLNLDFDVQPGQHILTTPQGNLFRNTGHIDYPYLIGDVGLITGSSNGDGFYYYFYDWKITKPAITCISERIPFNVILSATENWMVKDEIFIYPNPANNLLQIIIIEDNLPVLLTIFNTTGTEVYNKTLVEKESSIMLDTFPPGSYLVRLIQNGQVYFKKIVIQ